MPKPSSPRLWCFPALLIGFLLLSRFAVAQTTINAQITGGGGSGKCTFEVRVDGVADVQIRGNQGYLQTKAGAPAQWVRLRCNQPLPRNSYNFRFKGIDGRGRQYLVRDPNQNNGVAVIRIEDTRSGYQGYTGDIMWTGGNNNGGNWNGGWWNDNWNGGGGWGPAPPPPPSGGGWSKNIVPNCQNAIRRKVQQDAGGASVNFNGSPSTKQAASFVMVDGTGFGRASNGSQRNFTYHCTMHPNGNVADSSYNITGGTPQPR